MRVQAVGRWGRRAHIHLVALSAHRLLARVCLGVAASKADQTRLQQPAQRPGVGRAALRPVTRASIQWMSTCWVPGEGLGAGAKVVNMIDSCAQEIVERRHVLRTVLSTGGEKVITDYSSSAHGVEKKCHKPRATQTWGAVLALSLARVLGETLVSLVVKQEW